MGESWLDFFSVGGEEGQKKCLVGKLELYCTSKSDRLKLLRLSLLLPDRNQSEVDDNNSDDNDSDSDFEIASGKPSDSNTFSANSDSSETTLGSRYKARESWSSTQGYIKRPSSFRIKTLDDLRVFTQGEGKTYGPNESLWADNHAYEVIARYFRLDLLFIDHARKIGETPYRVLVSGEEGGWRR